MIHPNKLKNRDFDRAKAPAIRSKTDSSACLGVHSWVLAARPKTLTAAFVPVLVSSTLAIPYHFDLFLAICAILMVFSLQIATNLINDALDYVKGVDTPARLGPPRVVQKGLLDADSVMAAGWLMIAMAAFFSIPLIYEGGSIIAVLILCSLFLGYGYTGGPYPLSTHGLGDLFVYLFFGLAATMGLFFIQTKMLTFSSFIAASQVGLLATVMIAVNNLRDIEQDRIAGKKTVAVRLGVSGARIEVAALLLVPYLLGVYWFYAGYIFSAIAPLLLFPFACKIIQGVLREPPSRKYNVFLAQSALHQLFFGMLLAFALCI